MDMLLPTSTSISRYYTKCKLHHSSRSLSSSSSSYYFYFFFFIFFFFNGCGDTMGQQPVRFQSPLPSINETISYDLGDFRYVGLESWGTVWPIHKNPAVANLSGFEGQALSFAILCYVNTSADAFFLSVIVAADTDTVSSYLSGNKNDFVGNVSYRGFIAWMANRNKPAVTGGLPNLQIEEEAGLNIKSLVLRGRDGEEVWRVNAGNAPTIELRGDGNLVIVDNNTKSVVWQSFDHPTDTLVPGQKLRMGQCLVSRNGTGYSEGSYFMKIVDGGYSLYYNVSPFLQSYWSNVSTSCNVRNISVSLSPLGSLDISCNESQSIVNTDVVGNSTAVPIVRLEFDGVPRILINGQYADNTVQEPGGCDIPNKCSPYTACSPIGYFCSDVCNDELKEDCKPPYNMPSFSDTCTNQTLVYKMEKLSGISYFPNAYTNLFNVKVNTSKECNDSCYGNCTCAASFYDPYYSSCTLVKDVLQFTVASNQSYVGFIKMLVPVSPPATAARVLNQRNIIFLTIGLIVAFFLFCVAPGAFLVRRRWTTNADSGSETDVSDNRFLQAFQASLFTRFSYKDVQSITNNFTIKLGSGGFGSVFEGVMPDSNKVAVKRLDGISHQGTKEFHAEVAILANIHHFNLVKLLGFCAHGSQRMLIYEHMRNGSLDAWLFGDLSLTWATRHSIAIGVASGLAYLHEECENKVIHLDIKPQNILLDQNFVAKVGDFGMSRLMNREESCAYTTMRGTPGYLAPEWLLHGAANEKMDVYSFGMVLLELISSRKNYKPEIMEEDKRYFPAWAFKKAMEGQELEIIDPKLLSSIHTSEELKQIRTLIRVSFLCNQDNAHSRPRMSLVVKMLEGEASMPPLPLNNHVNSLTTRMAGLGLIGDSNIDTVSSTLQGR